MATSPPPLSASPVQDLTMPSPGAGSTEELTPSRWKGKGREPDTSHDSAEVDLAERPSSADPLQQSFRTERENSYPPVDDDVAEERKIAENMKRWSLLDKERRKAAREGRSSSIISTPPTTRPNITRRASKFWSGGSSRRPASGSRPVPLELSDDVTPRTSIGSPGTTPTTAVSQSGEIELRRHAPSHSLDSQSSASTITPDAPHLPQRTPSTSSSQDPFADTPKQSRNPFESPHYLETTTPPNRRGPTPKPLGLPTSITPSTSPPSSVKGMSAKRSRATIEDEEPDPSRERWWTDWLCGCRQDRDHQDGRTNPFE